MMCHCSDVTGENKALLNPNYIDRRVLVTLQRLLEENLLLDDVTRRCWLTQLGLQSDDDTVHEHRTFKPLTGASTSYSRRDVIVNVC